LPAERYLNLVKRKVTFGADASAPVFDTFDTGMRTGLGSDFRWVVYAAWVMPDLPGDVPGVAGSGEFYAQVMYGEQAAFLSHADDNVMCAGAQLLEVVTQGAAAIRWPMMMDVVAPKPVFSKQLTLGMVAINHEQYNNLEYVFCIQYGVAAIDSLEIIEELKARGTI
jgi:hypothetical protein